MPRAPKLCSRCSKTATRGSHCDDHRPAPFTKGANARARWQASRPGNYESLRRQCIRRDKGRCQSCGAEGTQVDHIKNVADGGKWVLSNLQLLCERCHQVKIQEEALRGLRSPGRG
jgi:5-methylcytosine-specific restriction protein A